ncbi:MAG: aldo/keto reductase [Thaumarchaeota archaeon]|nr:aldo/keto reductase [Nitrososphaerota archaeon]
MKVSEVGMGAVQASGQVWGQPFSDKEIIHAVKESYKAGVNLIDTAESYGRGASEKLVGRALKEVGRDNFVVATKVNSQHLRYDELQIACAASLERLGVDQIDLYQVHWPDPWEQIPLKHTFKALEKLYDEGKIRAIGVSNFAVRDLEEARSLLSHAEIVSNQVRYNLVQYEVEEEVLPYCKKNDIIVIAWEPIAAGALSGKYSVDSPPADQNRVNEYKQFRPENLEQIAKVMKVLSEISKRSGKTIPQVALNWLINSPNAAIVPIPGARNSTQARDNAGAAEWKMSENDMKALTDVGHQVKLNYFP